MLAYGIARSPRKSCPFAIFSSLPVIGAVATVLKVYPVSAELTSMAIRVVSDRRHQL